MNLNNITPKIMLILLFVLIIAVTAIAVMDEIKDHEAIKRGMPPGYYLESDGGDFYRPCRNGHPITWFCGSGSKAAAIRRAWGQAEYESKLQEEEKKWSVVEP